MAGCDRERGGRSCGVSNPSDCGEVAGTRLKDKTEKRQKCAWESVAHEMNLEL